ncbi:hypothetical protein AN640_04305 [Candidatus Epulonipiscium fishelsonii]|uniref:Uncharacterized protein n=1 Tax=Candidatus Epulonipiscium fishelsonii TaxID=77094 RepID=A0ACC8XIU9_9FIRM|nr:hypothetical protein AN640_04305 [Epulopiscium sp. SCG-D08WGA-EpuloA1]OON92051.1 MAG: hypothetical protein ATN32_02180 [Epulopiscium sp. AS2M-Bin002]
MKIKLKDLAKETGLSMSTISRALNEEQADKVKPESQQKINIALQKLGYSNQKSIRLEQLKLIGIILASNIKSLSHLLFSEIISNLEHNIYKKGYKVQYIIAESSMDSNVLENIISSNSVAGVICLGPLNQNLLNILQKYIIHIMYSSMNYTDLNVDQVVLNGYKAASTIVDHFCSINYTKIAYIGPIKNIAYQKKEHERFIGYKNALEAHNLIFDSTMVFNSLDEIEDGYSAMYKLLNLKQLPEAVLCAGDSIAIGAIRAAKENYVEIPKQIALAGMDNLKISSYLSPSLTTIDIQMTNFINLTIDMLIDKIEGKLTEPIKLEVPFDLIVRESCGYKLQR